MIPSQNDRRLRATISDSHKVSPARRVASLGIFLGLALILSYVEALLPLTFAVPGMKLGLANLAVVCALYYFGTRDAFLINIVRIFIVGLLFGTGYSLIYSLCGGILSFVAMLLLLRTVRLHIVSVSIGGGLFHNIGQLAAAAIMLRSPYILYYAPVLLIAGAVTGAVIGALAAVILHRVSISHSSPLPADLVPDSQPH